MCFSKRCAAPLVLLYVLFAPNVYLRAENTVFVEAGSEWRFLPGVAEPSEEALGWAAAEFNDADWELAPAPFGFGDPPYGTDLSEREPPMRGNYTTFYLRREFEIADPSEVTELHFLADFDDGFIVYLNGVEVVRANARGEIGAPEPFDTRAQRGHESGEYEPFPLTSPREFIRAGRNVVAVHALNASRTSNDMKFDLELIDPFGPDRSPPAVASLLPPAGATVRRLEEIEVVFSESVTGVTANSLVVNGAPAIEVRGAEAGPYRFRLAEPAAPGEATVRWSADQAIFDRAEEPNAFAGGTWTYSVDPDAPPPTLRISEFLAANGSGIIDADRDTPDWVEIENYGDQPIDLAGWSLSDDADDPSAWVFPGHVLAPGERLVVFASAKDRVEEGEFHASFKLNRSGDSVYLYPPEIPRAAVSFFEDYPAQRPDHSYGVATDGSVGYFFDPTPGEVNPPESVLASFVEDPIFSVEHGFFSEGFELELSTPTPEAKIFYSLDGSEPLPERGEEYAGPIAIEGSAARAVVTVRAAAYRDKYLPSRVITQTYLFPALIGSQPPRPAGFPARWGSGNADYAMDPDVVGADDNPALVEAGFRSIPAISIVGDVNHIFGSQGIYPNSEAEGVRWERPASAEWIYPEGVAAPDGDGSFQINCGLRIHGGASRIFSRSPKHSFRFLFKGAYGPTRLRRRVFEDSELDSFDTLILRANYNNSWIHNDGGQRGRASMIRDQWARDTMRDMGQASPHGRYVNLFVNGLFWGVYNLVERPSAPFAADYLGGSKDEWDALNSAQPVNGDTLAWRELLAAAANVSTPEGYNALFDQLDLVNFVDYMIMNFYGANADWPSHNWYSARRRQEGAKWFFFSWDAERILEGNTANRTGVSEGNSPGQIWTRLRAHPEFQVAFGDRVEKHFSPGGTLTPQAAAARWETRAEQLEPVVILESARWGDYRQARPYGMLDWTRERNRLLNSHFPARSNAVLGQFRNIRVYSRTGAPIASVDAGEVDAGTAVELSLPNGQEGQILYTLDGSDPREAFAGAASASAMAYTSAIPITAYTILKARTLDGESWSALREAIYTVPSSSPDGLVISEIHYRPAEGGELEFVELLHTGDSTADLAGLRFTSGLTFEFSEGDFLASGERLVLVANEQAFRAAYPDVEPFGVFEGGLANGGEKLTIKDETGVTIFSVEYDDDGFWPLAADGFGSSLIYMGGEFVPDDPRAWRASSERGGSPGALGAEPSFDQLAISEVRMNGRLAVDAIEIVNLGPSTVGIQHDWFVSTDRSDASTLQSVSFQVRLAPGEFFVLEENPANGESTIFELDPAEPTVYLSNLAGTEITALELGLSADVSYGRYETSLGLESVVLESSSLGGANGDPRAPLVAINEIHYHPVDAAGVEFIELYNPRSDPRSLAGWEIRGISSPSDDGPFVFPEGAEIPSEGYLVVAPMAPDEFRAEFGVPDGAVVVGPYAGALENRGERLRLLAPIAELDQAEEIDAVRYNDTDPWPVEPDGAGPSLERIGAHAYSNEPLNWASSTTDGGTPGARNTVAEDATGGLQLAGDIDQDGRLTVTDPIQILGHLFRGSPADLPCGDRGIASEGNRELLDADGDASVNIADAIAMLNYLFRRGAPHVLGRSCVRIAGCPSACR